VKFPIPTGAVCDLLQIPQYTINTALLFRQLPHPPKDASGRYMWGAADVANLKALLEARAARKAARGRKA
jgi:hypothetical protein